MFHTQIETAPPQRVPNSAFEVRTTKGMVSALITPNFGMLNRQTLSSSNNIASKA
jgi:hypothetical protein